MDILRPINVAEARAQVMTSISIFRRMARLVELVGPFFGQLPEKVTAGHAAKLEKFLVTEAPELKVYSVTRKAESYGQFSGVRFTVRMYDMGDCGEQSFHFPWVGPGDGVEASHWKWGEAMHSHRNWAQDADYLESVLPILGQRAKKFNETLEALRDAALICLPGPQDTRPVYPLTDIFKFHELRG